MLSFESSGRASAVRNQSPSAFIGAFVASMYSTVSGQRYHFAYDAAPARFTVLRRKRSTNGSGEPSFLTSMTRSDRASALAKAQFKPSKISALSRSDSE